MKKLIVLTALSLSMVACVKTETKKTEVNIPKINKPQLATFKQTGLKCDMVGEVDHKEIFIKLETKDGKTKASFHDFTSASKITIVGASYGNYSLLSFSMHEVPEDNQTLIGETPLIHTDKASLSDEGKVLSITGKLTLNKDMTGKLEQNVTILMDDNTTKTSDLEEVAVIENCEEFEASWL